MKKFKSVKPVVFLLLGLGCLGCKPTSEQTTPQFSRPYGSDEPMEEAAILGEGIISTGDYEINTVFTHDGKTLYFTKCSHNFNFCTIVVSHFENGTWSEPEIASFSGQYSDADPFFSPDESKIFFVSTRPTDGTASKDYDIWMVEKTDAGWSEAMNLGMPVNTESNEFYPSVTADGTLYFSSRRGQGYDIYQSRWVDGKYTEPERLGDAINSDRAEIDTYVAPDASYIVFASYGRSDSHGSGDLYISYNRDGEWTPAKNLGDKINSHAREFCPIASPDGKYFFFTSTRGFGSTRSVEEPIKTYRDLSDKLNGILNGMGNIYQIDISALNVEHP